MTQEPEMQEKRRDDELTSKFSTEQLICKTPQESPNTSVKSLKSDKAKVKQLAANYLLQLGLSQVILGMLMAAFGILVILHNARMAQIGGGIWGGCLATASGVAGILAAAKSWCPLKGSAQRIAHTTFLALSLVVIAVSQLVLVLAATGLARDINRTDAEQKIGDEIVEDETEAEQMLPTMNHLALVYNSGLVVVAALECVCAVVASYKSARSLCACFRHCEEGADGKIPLGSKEAFVSSWLGKHTMPPSLYVVAAQPKNKTTPKWNSDPLTLAPIVRLPHRMLPPQQPPVMGYPLIPAPLGPVPSPMIPMRPKDMVRRKHKVCHSAKHRIHKERHKKPYTKPRRKHTSEIDVVQTYTGLDRVIAEEFIDICDSRNNSLCSNCSCQSGCNCISNGCEACANSCTKAQPDGNDINARDG